MWIVRLALRRPYTFTVVSLLMLILGVASIVTMPTDIFPNIDIPVVSVIWNYTGMTPDEMEARVTTIAERTMTTAVNDIEHIESQTYNGVAVIKIYFQPGANVGLAIAQLSSTMETILRVLPPGIFPPLIIRYNASTVPILQLSVHSSVLTEQQLYDYAQNFIRTQLATVQGASIPLPYGGKVRQIMVDLDPAALYAKHLSATDVSNAINAQNLVFPAGSARIGAQEYLVKLNSSPGVVSALNDLPIKSVNGSIVYIRDVAQVRDGYAVQTNIVRINGTRGTLLTVLKSGTSSTLYIINAVKAALPKILAGLNPNLAVSQLFDQSLFVRASIREVVREGIIAAGLTALMILLFLGSWRSTLIVSLSIPLSILTSIIILNALGQTINVMTLGGLALAVGILVDDATVEIENVHRNMGMNKTLVRAILDGAQQIATPAFVATLSICIVFVPVLLLTGAAKYLFTPLAMAVVFAMLTSYFLTRTLVPTLVHYLLPPELELYKRGERAPAQPSDPWLWRFHHGFDERFERMRQKYGGLLDWCLHHRGAVSLVFALFVLASFSLLFFVGTDFFPYVDSGQMRLHVRPRAGTRIESSEQIFAKIEDEIRREIPPAELDTIIDNIGLPNSGINLAFSDSATIGNFDGDILISLKPGHHSTLGYERQLRAVLKDKYPENTYFFQAANITNQILNFGLAAPIDVQIVGRNAQANFDAALRLARRINGVPGAVDVYVHQVVDAPAIQVNVDRDKAILTGMSQRDVASSMLIALSGSGQTAPNQWLNPQNGVTYQIVVQTPLYRINTFNALYHTPLTGPDGLSTQLLANLTAPFQRATAVEIVNHQDIQPTFDVMASTDMRDLGGVASDVRRIVQDEQSRLPKGSIIAIRGQVETMHSSFVKLGLGIGFAILFVYLLMAVNFQSWVDPFIILMALPGAFAGILWMLFLTQTTISVPALMGTIMAIGVATSNSILLVTFANDERAEGKDAVEAAHSAGITRIRPVIMTALAMIIGMLPMSLALGEGGEQNAPLGRAVIGGLIIATFTTLFFVPIMYSFLRRRPPVDLDRRIAEEAGEGGPGSKAA